MRIVAVMPIKLNNERLPGKNTMILGDKPLLQHTLLNLRKLELLDEIDVFCSDRSIIPFLPEGITFRQREKKLDLPSSNFTQIFESYQREQTADIYLYAHATAPFVTVQTMKECVDSVVSGEYDSAFCALKIQDYLWQDQEPLNFDASNIPRSQDIPPIYRETSGIYVFRREVFEKYQRRIGKKPYIKEVSYKEAVDINNPEDFQLAQALVGIDL